MSSKKDGIMLILSSPSGAGKTTLVRLLSKNRDFHISISHTTRKPRINEIQDEDYHFVDNDKFENLIKKDEFLEYAKVFNHFYGTTKTPVINNLKNGDEKTEENVQDNGNYFSWAEKKDVKKFIQSNKKYVELRDFFSLVFYNPKKF